MTSIDALSRRRASRAPWIGMALLALAACGQPGKVERAQSNAAPASPIVGLPSPAEARPAVDTKQKQELVVAAAPASPPQQASVAPPIDTERYPQADVN